MARKEHRADIVMGGRVNPSLRRAGASACKTLKNIHSYALGAIGLTAGIGSAFLSSMEKSRDLNKNMANVATLIPGNIKRVKELKKNIQGLAMATGKESGDLSDGLYQVISAFGDSAESARILEIAAKASVAGVAETIDAINLTAAVTKGYGDTSVKAAQKANDLAFLTVKLGQTTYPELARTMGRVIPLANTMKVSQEELFGAMATLTGVTGGTAEVTTQLRGTIQGFLQPTTQMTAAIKKLGYADGKALIKAQGLQGALNLLKKSVNNNELAFSALFGSIEAKTAVLALTGSQVDNFTNKTKSMYNATGAATEAFREQAEGINKAGYQWDRLTQIFTTYMQQFGDKTAEIIFKTADFCKALAEYKEAIIATFTGAAVAAVIANFGAISWAALGLAIDFGALAVATWAAMAPWLPWAAGIGAVTWAVMKLTKAWKKFNEEKTGDLSKNIIKPLSPDEQKKYNSYINSQKKATISNIPSHAYGAKSFGGLTYANEGGNDEIFNLPNGTNILSNRLSKQLFSTGGGFQIAIKIEGNADENTMHRAAQEAFSDFARKYEALINRKNRLGCTT